MTGIENIYASIQLTDYKNQDENFVREEFLVPLFKCVGYEGFGLTHIARGVNLSSCVNISTKGKRRNIYPDFVLYRNNAPLWIVDAKSPKIRVDSSANLQQVINYSTYLQCPNIILSNAIETYIYQLEGTKIKKSVLYTLDELKSLPVLESLLNSLSPESAVKAIYTFDEAIDLYSTNDYVDRSFLMKLLQLYGVEEVRTYLLRTNFTDTFRNRALPAILMSRYASEDPGLFRRISIASLKDKNSVVRENFLTCLVSDREYINEFHIVDEIYDYERKTFLEEILYITFLSTTRKGKRILQEYKYRSNMSFLSDYGKLLLTTTPVAFPVALPLSKPKHLSYKDYCHYLEFLPMIIEKIDGDVDSHPETLKVMSDCLQYSRANSPMLFKVIGSSASRRQKSIIEYFSSSLIT